MVRRQKKTEEVGASMDSLMDALTNVVAVLIFVLLLVNCDVSQKVVKMMEDIIPVSEEDLLKVKDLLKDIEIDEKKLEEIRKQTPPSQLDIDEMQATVQSLQEQIKNRKSQVESNNQAISELQKLHDQVLQERDVEKKKTEALMAEIEKLQILLDTTPVPNDIPPTEITIPATRPIPEDARVFYAYVKNDRVHFFDPQSYIDKIIKAIEVNKKDLMVDLQEEDNKEDIDKEKDRKSQKNKDKDKEKVILYDNKKMLDFMSKLELNLPPGQKAVFQMPDWANHIRFMMQPDFKVGGASLEDLKKPNNAFSVAVSKVRPPKEVIMFVVDEKSMPTYILARDIVENKKIPCGWKVSDNIGYDTGIKGVKLKPTATPPPSIPNPNAPQRARKTGDKLD